MGLSDRVEEAIKMTGLSRNEFARRSGVAQPRLHEIIHGKVKRPSYDTVAGIADAASVNLKWLATGRGEMYAGTPRADEAAKLASRLQQLGGPLTDKELGFIKMLRTIEQKDPKGYNAITSQIIACYAGM